MVAQLYLSTSHRIDRLLGYQLLSQSTGAERVHDELDGTLVTGICLRYSNTMEQKEKKIINFLREVQQLKYFSYL